MPSLGVRYDTVSRVEHPPRGDGEDALKYWIRTEGRYNGVKLESLQLPDLKRHQPWSDNSGHIGGSGWMCVLQYDKRSMTFPFFMGSAHKGAPKLRDVLECLLLDYSTERSSDTFENWCDELGYDNDSISAREVFDRVDRQNNDFAYVFTEEVLESLFELERD